MIKLGIIARQYFYITERSKAIVMWWFLLFDVLVLIFCAASTVYTVYVFIFLMGNLVATYMYRENGCTFGLQNVFLVHDC